MTTQKLWRFWRPHIHYCCSGAKNKSFVGFPMARNTDRGVRCELRFNVHLLLAQGDQVYTRFWLFSISMCDHGSVHVCSTIHSEHFSHTFITQKHRGCHKGRSLKCWCCCTAVEPQVLLHPWLFGCWSSPEKVWGGNALPPSHRPSTSVEIMCWFP